MRKLHCWRVSAKWAVILTIALMVFLAARSLRAEAIALCRSNQDVLRGSAGCAEFWINRYQTLLSGILALISALATILFIRKQIQIASAQLTASEDQARDERSRLLQASRAMLPLALNEMSDYADECLTLCLRFVEKEKELEHGSPAPPYGCPPLPRTAFDHLHAAIRYSEPEIQTRLAKLVVMIQIQNSRLLDLYKAATQVQSRTVITRSTLYDAVADALDVSGAVSSIYPYARGDRTQEPFFQRPSLFAYDIEDARYPELFAYLEKRPLLYSEARRN